MADDGDTKERAAEKEGARREEEERGTEQHGPADRAGRDDPAEEGLLDGVPAARANKPTG
jgi:hypothetical protein